MPEVVTHIVSVLGGVLPALGIAMLMNILIKKKAELVFFFLGFVLIAFAKLNTVALVFIAAAFAYVVYLSTGNKGNVATETVETKATVTEELYEDNDMFE